MYKPKASIKINENNTIIGVIIAPSTAARRVKELINGRTNMDAHYFKCQDTWKVKDDEIDMVSFGHKTRIIYKNGDIITDEEHKLEYDII